MSSTHLFSSDSEDDLFEDLPELEPSSDSEDSGTESEESELETMPDFNEIDSDMTDEELDNATSPEEERDQFIYQKTFTTLSFLDQINFKIVDFLDALSWGSEKCTQDPKIRSERRVLLENPKLTTILNRWAKPPRPLGSKRKRPEGAQSVMKEFAINQVEKVTNVELEELAEDLLSPTSEDTLKETLTSTSFADLEDRITEKAPVLWKVLKALGTKPSQTKNTHKDPTKVREYN